MIRAREAFPRLAVTETALGVRFADVDMMDLVHHTVYLHWFEQIRFHFLDRVAGLSLTTLRHEGIAFPVVSCSAQYLRPVRFGDQPVGYCRMVLGRKALVTLQYEILLGQGGPVCARGQTAHCYVDRTFKLLVAVPAVLQGTFERAALEHPAAFTLEEEMAVPRETAIRAPAVLVP